MFALTERVHVTKSDDRRSVILNKLANYVLAEGLSAASLRPMAKAAGISDRMLLYYFKDKADVISATLEQVSSRLVTMLGEQTAAAPLPLDAFGWVNKDTRARLCSDCYGGHAEM